MVERSWTKESVDVQELYLQRLVSYIDGIERASRYLGKWDELDGEMEEIIAEGAEHIERELRDCYEFTLTKKTKERARVLMEGE